MNKLNEKIFKKYLTNSLKCGILYIEIKKGGRKIMKEIKVTKTMYETVDGRRFETRAEATNHEMNLEYHKDIISLAMRIKKMCSKYVEEGEYEGYGECSNACPFKKEYGYCMLDDSPCNWTLPPINSNPS